MVEGGSILHADHPRKWVIFACRSTDTAAYLVVTSIPKPDKTEQIQNYVSQITPYLVSRGAEPVSRFGVIEQLAGEEGIKNIAVMKFASAQAIKDTLSGDEYRALEVLRDEALSQVNLMICSAF